MIRDRLSEYKNFPGIFREVFFIFSCRLTEFSRNKTLWDFPATRLPFAEFPLMFFPFFFAWGRFFLCEDSPFSLALVFRPLLLGVSPSFPAGVFRPFLARFFRPFPARFFRPSPARFFRPSPARFPRPFFTFFPVPFSSGFLHPSPWGFSVFPAFFSSGMRQRKLPG